MKLKENFFYKKKILIYGLGKSGSACFEFLNRNNNLLSSLITGTRKTIYTDNNAERKKKIDCIRCIIL